MTKFTKSFKATQATIAQKVKALQAATKASLEKKQAVDGSNVNLGACRKVEKTRLKQYEDCRRQGAWSNQTWKEACDAMDNARYHRWSIMTELTAMHSCNLYMDNCTNLDKLK